MKKILFLLFSLIIIGILWLRSSFWEFSEEAYVPRQLLEKTILIGDRLDIDFLKEEFGSAYGF